MQVLMLEIDSFDIINLLAQNQPSPLYPSLHLHSYFPGVFVQTALMSQ